MNIADPTGLAGELIQATVPGAYYQNIATQQFQSGNYGAAAFYEVVALGDAALGIVTGGVISRAQTGIKAGVNSIIGPFSAYDTSVTARGAKHLNVETFITSQNFQSNLISNGYRVTSQSGGKTVLSNGNSTYALYGRTSLNGSPGAHYVGPDGTNVKFVFRAP